MNHFASSYGKNVMGLVALKECYVISNDNMTESMDGNEDQL